VRLELWRSVPASTLYFGRKSFWALKQETATWFARWLLTPSLRRLWVLDGRPVDEVRVYRAALEINESMLSDGRDLFPDFNERLAKRLLDKASDRGIHWIVFRDSFCNASTADQAIYAGPGSVDVEKTKFVFTREPEPAR
jgi:hypothetical protein